MKFLLWLFLVLMVQQSLASLYDGTRKPNILLILTDDQDVKLGGMLPMKNVEKLMEEQGINFKNAFTSAPICCPSRASLLSGLYAHNHHTKNNSLNGGCYGSRWKKEIEPKALPVVLHKSGYQTFFAGKYLNQYYDDKVPAGWSDFHGLLGNSKYYNYTLNENGYKKDYNDKYLTDHIRDLTIEFLESRKDNRQPFFAMISPPAPHAPYTPADRHKGAFHGQKAMRTPNFNMETNFFSKHWLVSSSKKISNPTLSLMDEYFEKRWETLLAVDEMVAALFEKLEDLNELSNTYVIYTSDNGYHIGQFAQPFDKRQPYDTDINVPLLIRGPNIPKGHTITVPVSLIDLYPTILEWIGLPIDQKLDGLSFNVFIKNALHYEPLNDSSYHRGILVQHWGEGNDDTYNPQCPQRLEDHLAECTMEADCHCQDSWNNTYSCIRHFRSNINRLYCEFQDYENFIEAYDVNEDPFQMTNIIYDMLPIEQALYNLALANLTKCSGSSCGDIII